MLTFLAGSCLDPSHLAALFFLCHWSAPRGGSGLPCVLDPKCIPAIQPFNTFFSRKARWKRAAYPEIEDDGIIFFHQASWNMMSIMNMSCMFTQHHPTNFNISWGKSMQAHGSTDLQVRCDSAIFCIWLASPCSPTSHCLQFLQHHCDLKLT